MANEEISPDRPGPFVKTIYNCVCETLDDDAGLELIVSTCYIYITKAGKPYLVHSCDAKWCSVSSRGLVDADCCWNGPDEHVYERIGHHLV